MAFYLGKKSKRRAAGVHPDMIAVAELALSYGVLDFGVAYEGGVRTLEQQKILVAKGVSNTLKSKHLIQSDGYGRAIDLLPPIRKPEDWKNITPFNMMGSLMFRAAAELGIKIEWGGHYTRWRKDYPHFNLVGV